MAAPRSTGTSSPKNTFVSGPSRRQSSLDAVAFLGSMITGMDHIEQLRRARSEFERRLIQVRADHLGLPTPCSEWTVRKLLEHVIAADYAYVALLYGSSAEQFHSLVATFDMGDDPLTEFQSSAAKVISAFDEPGALERTVQHPIGEIPAVQLLGMQVAEWTVHSWDLARALAVDDSLDAELVEFIYALLAPLADTLVGTGHFQPSTRLPDSAPLQDRLLDLLGRRP